METHGEDTGIKRKKIISWSSPFINKRDTSTTTGLEYLERVRDGLVPPPPVAQLVGYTLIEVSHGAVVFELNPEEYHYNPFVSVHGGILSTVLDTAMTASIFSTLTVAQSCTTLEIKVNFIRMVTEQSGKIRCNARPIHIGRQNATAEGWLRDGRGDLCAHGVCTCWIFRHD